MAAPVPVAPPMPRYSRRGRSRRARARGVSRGVVKAWCPPSVIRCRTWTNARYQWVVRNPFANGVDRRDPAAIREMESRINRREFTRLWCAEMHGSLAAFANAKRACRTEAPDTSSTGDGRAPTPGVQAALVSRGVDDEPARRVSPRKCTILYHACGLRQG